VTYEFARAAYESAQENMIDSVKWEDLHQDLKDFWWRVADAVVTKVCDSLVDKYSEAVIEDLEKRLKE
jgi:hypothetical protein